MSPSNKCHVCGATTYAQVIERDACGAMRPNGVYQCTGCKALFTSIYAWRTGQPEAAPAQSHSPNAALSVSIAAG